MGPGSTRQGKSRAVAAYHVVRRSRTLVTQLGSRSSSLPSSLDTATVSPLHRLRLHLFILGLIDAPSIVYGRRDRCKESGVLRPCR